MVNSKLLAAGSDDIEIADIVVDEITTNDNEDSTTTTEGKAQPFFAEDDRTNVPMNEEGIAKFFPPSEEDDIAAFNELKGIAVAANPVVGYFDPLNLVDAPIDRFNGRSETIGWLRQAEIKHGRVAMAAFVGYIVQSQGIKWPFFESLWPTVAGPESQWDALDTRLKYSIILFVGLLELTDEADPIGHYVRGTKEPGRHPSFQGNPTKRSEKDLADGRIKEINNGRLAMIGIMGFVSSSSVQGSVPFLDGINVPAYEGNFWAPFERELSKVDDVVATTTAVVTTVVEKVVETVVPDVIVPEAVTEAVTEVVTEVVTQAASVAATTATTAATTAISIPSEFALMQQ